MMPPFVRVFQLLKHALFLLYSSSIRVSSKESLKKNIKKVINQFLPVIAGYYRLLQQGRLICQLEADSPYCLNILCTAKLRTQIANVYVDGIIVP